MTDSTHELRLQAIEHKNKEGKKLHKADLSFLYEIKRPIDLGVEFQTKPARVKAVISGRDIVADICLVTGLKPSQVSVSAEQAVKGGVKIHYGDLLLPQLFRPYKKVVLPKRVIGALRLPKLVSVKNVVLPEQVDDGLYLSALKTAENLVLPSVCNGDIALGGLTSVSGVIFPKKVRSLDLKSLVSVEGFVPPKIVTHVLYLDSVKRADGLCLPNRVGILSFKKMTDVSGLSLPKPKNCSQIHLPKLSVNKVQELPRGYVYILSKLADKAWRERKDS